MGNNNRFQLLQDAFKVRFTFTFLARGMCTPGMIMSIYGHLAKGGSTKAEDGQN